MPSFIIAPLTGHTGAGVVGLDITQPIDDDTRATLNEAPPCAHHARPAFRSEGSSIAPPTPGSILGVKVSLAGSADGRQHSGANFYAV